MTGTPPAEIPRARAPALSLIAFFAVLTAPVDRDKSTTGVIESDDTPRIYDVSPQAPVLSIVRTIKYRETMTNRCASPCVRLK